jgi:ABC-type nickel/cobalt efflux system permease component RcnA
LAIILCGIGHVLSWLSGIVGIAAGIALDKLELIEARGEIAGWALISFGFLYMIWGIKKAYNNKPHSHIHVSDKGTYSTHHHEHHGEHVHKEEKKSLTPWILFVVFILGPCEPLIPLLMFPAAQHSVLINNCYCRIRNCNNFNNGFSCCCINVGLNGCRWVN